jgi:hypothetical protein
LFHYLNEDCMIFLINHNFFFLFNFFFIYILLTSNLFYYYLIKVLYVYIRVHPILLCNDINMYRRVYCTTLKINNLFFILKKKQLFFVLFIFSFPSHIFDLRNVI